jgi:hypothetical protein
VVPPVKDLMSSASTFALAQLSPWKGSGADEIVFSLALSTDYKHLLAATSQGDLCNLDPYTLSLTRRWHAHDQRIVDAHFQKGSPVACTFGMEGRIAGWDMRASALSGAAFKIDTGMPLTTGHIEPFGSNLLVTGSEAQSRQGVIAFWDQRQLNAPVCKWTDQHTEDVTMVRFRPDKAGCLVSSSIDGLLCQSQFDALLAPQVDDALQSVIPLPWPIDAFSFTPVSGHEDMVAVISPMNTVALARLNTGDLLSRGDESATGPGSLSGSAGSSSAIVTVAANPATDCPLLFSGLQDGSMLVHAIHGPSPDHIVQVASFGTGVHRDLIRCALYLPQEGVVFTGGEDARIAGWEIQ